MVAERITWLKWWDAKTYKDFVSTTDWMKAYDRLALSAYAIAMFNPKNHPDLDKGNGGNCAYAVRVEMIPIGDKKKDKAQAKMLLQNAKNKVLSAIDKLDRTGKWPDGGRKEFHVITA
jgi:hypothetical protein